MNTIPRAMMMRPSTLREMIAVEMVVFISWMRWPEQLGDHHVTAHRQPGGHRHRQKHDGEGGAYRCHRTSSPRTCPLQRCPPCCTAAEQITRHHRQGQKKNSRLRGLPSVRFLTIVPFLSPLFVLHDIFDDPGQKLLYSVKNSSEENPRQQMSFQLSRIFWTAQRAPPQRVRETCFSRRHWSLQRSTKPALLRPGPPPNYCPLIRAVWAAMSS